MSDEIFMEIAGLGYCKVVKAERPKPALHCSFCGKSQYVVKKMIAGQNVFICDECVRQCMSIVDEALPKVDLSEGVAEALFESKV